MTASLKIVHTVFPETALSMAARSAITSCIKAREYTTRWCWGELDLRSITPVDRDPRRGGGGLGGGLRRAYGGGFRHRRSRRRVTRVRGRCGGRGRGRRVGRGPASRSVA